MIAVSACLLGYCVRYDGKHQLYTPLKKLYEDGLVISICPEVFGGLPTPRASAEIMGEMVMMYSLGELVWSEAIISMSLKNLFVVRILL